MKISRLRFSSAIYSVGLELEHIVENVVNLNLNTILDYFGSSYDVTKGHKSVN